MRDCIGHVFVGRPGGSWRCERCGLPYEARLAAPPMPEGFVDPYAPDAGERLEAALSAPVVPDTGEVKRSSAAPRDWLIWSNEHGAWWRGARWGYTVLIEKAGRYTEAEAKQICTDANLCEPKRGDALNEIALRVPVDLPS